MKFLELIFFWVCWYFLTVEFGAWWSILMITHVFICCVDYGSSPKFFHYVSLGVCVRFSVLICLWVFAVAFAWDYENEGCEDFVASSLFECDFLWSGKEVLRGLYSCICCSYFQWYPTECSSLNLGLVHISCRLLIHQHALLTLVRNAVIQVNGKGNSFLGFQRLSMRWG